MRSHRPRWIRHIVALARGGITPGVLQGFNLVNFASLFASLLATWLSAIVTALFGGDISDLV